ncbi:MAG: class I SAM-dependent methyltransferase [Candidatus Cohnella colombiensis]|uniref:Class I SAM-dependent methyltransferase n=1 Tax=Candidatus Cohnella colombiensis TaxID=3121368 RepID=A0AA95JEA4_9BACL|nr:MAG: class I SAM-dependent methyltransferase [Cohnella sp.]
MMMEKGIVGAGVKLSRRLAALASWVPQGARFADIGTDHALLPVFLASQERISYAVAGDVHEGPVEAATRQVRDAGLEGVISVRLGDGLAVLNVGEVDTVAIAGMGGSLMVRILEQGIDKLSGVSTLVLSPHVAEGSVRQWLVKHHYVIDQELLLEEDGVIYTLIRAVRLNSEAVTQERQASLYDQTLLSPVLPRIARVWMEEMGPLLLRNPSPEFYKNWEQEIAKRERVILQLSYSEAPGAAEKASEWQEDVRQIKEVLACLPEVKRSSN